MSYRKTARSVYDLKYHPVWITKYRKPVSRGEVAPRLQECATVDVQIEKRDVAPDYIHLVVSVPTHIAVSKLVQPPKGRSRRRLLEGFGELCHQF